MICLRIEVCEVNPPVESYWYQGSQKFENAWDEEGILGQLEVQVLAEDMILGGFLQLNWEANLAPELSMVPNKGTHRCAVSEVIQVDRNTLLVAKQARHNGQLLDSWGLLDCVQASLHAVILGSGSRWCIEMLDKTDKLHFEYLEAIQVQIHLSSVLRVLMEQGATSSAWGN